MNYYDPNYFMRGYPNYGNQFPFIPQQPTQMQDPAAIQRMIQQNNQSSMQQPQGLNGKIVDGEDVVRATEVPVGGYGIFPKADLSEIYIKSWNNNGTTSVISYRPVVPDPNVSANNRDSKEITSILLQKIEMLENKIDIILSHPNNGNVELMSQPQPQQVPVQNNQNQKQEVHF